ncbi:FabD/lysophospholipase-like protein [Atractiella rhizophila]|nr:FabD/lysophospholipase-like protein [Atractiella rhizophila]
MLKSIEEKCFDIPIVWLFDLIVGTSIGGLLALSLTSGKSPYSLNELATLFPNLMKKGFTPHVPFFDSLNMLAVMVGGAKFEVGALEATLQKHFGDLTVVQGPGKGGPFPRVAVTTVSHQNLGKHLVPNYNRRVTDEEADFLLLRPKTEDCMKVWQAGRCTSAAYPYFPAFPFQSDNLDGGFAMNCPAEIAFDEGQKIWEDRNCDIFLSIGTGTKPKPRSPPLASKSLSLNGRGSLSRRISLRKKPEVEKEDVNLIQFEQELRAREKRGTIIPRLFRPHEASDGLYQHQRSPTRHREHR